MLRVSIFIFKECRIILALGMMMSYKAYVTMTLYYLPSRKLAKDENLWAWTSQAARELMGKRDYLYASRFLSVPHTLRPDGAVGIISRVALY